MCSPNVHYQQRTNPFNDNPFLAAHHDATLAAPSAPAPPPSSSSLSRAPSYDFHKATRANAAPRNHHHRYHHHHDASRATSSAATTLHHTITHSSSVLSLAVDEQHALAFSGSQSECIYVWDLDTYQQRTRLEGHTGSVLALELAPEKNWLFSSSGDNTVRIWDTETLAPLYVVYPAEDNVGDIFALKWCSQLQTLYLGCQNTSIQWICLLGVAAAASHAGPANDAGVLPRGSDSPMVATPSAFPVSRPHRFFDSVSLKRSRSNNNAATTDSGKAGIGFRGPATPSLGTQGYRFAASVDPRPRGGGGAYAGDGFTDEVLSAASDRLHGISLDVAGARVTTGHSRPAVETLVVPQSCSVSSAHFGYIYTFTLLTLEGDHRYNNVLASGSGDETVKLWHATPEGLVHLATLESANTDGNAVMALASWKSTLFAGLQGGDVEVWDLETCTLARTLRAHDDDVLAIEACSHDGCLFTASADGRIRRWDRSFRCTDEWKAHDGIILSLASIRQPGPTQKHKGQQHQGQRGQEQQQRSQPRPMLQLVTGSSDNLIKTWNLPQKSDGDASILTTGFSVDGPSSSSTVPESSTLLSILAQFVRYKSVSSVEDRENCRQAAHFLKACLSRLGAEAKILANVPGHNPLVLATFKANGPRSRSGRRRPNDLSGNAGEEAPSAPPVSTKRCLFYGHYDCIAAEGQWESDPFRMDGRDGYLYGRGVSDNKGPILAAACAASELLTLRQLDADVVFLIEGEEESGSIGFKDAVRAYKDEIGAIDVILLSNSYWLGEDTPCLTVGLRGVIRATITVSGDERDVHSGVEGGAVREPMIDMIKILSSLSTGSNVAIPGFYDAVRPVTASETAQYEAIARIKHLGSISSSTTSLSSSSEISGIAQSLMAKWRHPSFSVHHMRVSGPGNSTVIPSKVSASVSLRLVPDQDLSQIEESLRRHIHTLRSTLLNDVTMTVEHRADWWSSSDSTPFFNHLEEAVRQEWKLRKDEGPLCIREGGSIPAIAILEKELLANALHLPMGQSSDNAHLPNERIRLVNLRKGKMVVCRFLLALGKEEQEEQEKGQQQEKEGQGRKVTVKHVDETRS